MPLKSGIGGIQMDEYINYIREKLDKRELLEQLAEECSELIKASMDVIRTDEQIANNNPASCSYKEAKDNFREEVLDVLMVLMLLGELPNDGQVTYSWKWGRWAKRLGCRENY